jgi:hypothetical protein
MQAFKGTISASMAASTGEINSALSQNTTVVVTNSTGPSSEGENICWPHEHTQIMCSNIATTIKVLK